MLYAPPCSCMLARVDGRLAGGLLKVHMDRNKWRCADDSVSQERISMETGGGSEDLAVC